MTKLYKHIESGRVVLANRNLEWGLVLVDRDGYKSQLNTVNFKSHKYLYEEFDGIIKLKPSKEFSLEQTFIIATERRIFFHRKGFDRVFYILNHNNEIGYMDYMNFLYYMQTRAGGVMKGIKDGIIELKNKTKVKKKMNERWGNVRDYKEYIMEQLQRYNSYEDIEIMREQIRRRYEYEMGR